MKRRELPFTFFLGATVSVIVTLSGCSSVGRFLFGEREYENRAMMPVKDAAGRIVELNSAAAEFSPDTAAAGGKGIVRLSDESFTQVPVHQLSSSGTINSLSVSRDGRTAYTGASDGSVMGVELVAASGKSTGNKLRITPLIQGEKPVLALAVSPNGQFLAISKFSLVSILDLQRMKVIYQMSRIPGRILSLAWDPRGELLALGRANGDIFVWNLIGGLSAGEDSLDAIESYEGASAPILHLAFHPSSRAFFSAAQDGTVLLWRLLRTERELGLRDDWADVDKVQRGTKYTSVGRLTGRVEDMYLDSRDEELLAGSSTGIVYRWKIRGLKQRNQIPLGTDAAASFRIIDPHLLASSGRGQRLKLFCRNDGIGDTDEAPVPVIRQQPVVAAQDAEMEVVDGELRLNRNDGADAAPPAAAATDNKAAAIPVAESNTLAEPIGILRSGDQPDLLWGTQKTGSLLLFNAKSVLGSATGRAIVERCRRQLPGKNVS